MPSTPPPAEMGRRHEQHLAETLGGWRTKNSGATPTDKGDGAHHHDDPFAFRWDGKSTKGQSISVTLAMIAKIREQAGGERPAIPLRWYGNAMLTQVLEDWIAVQLDDFTELVEAASAWVQVARAMQAASLLDPRCLATPEDACQALARLTEAGSKWDGWSKITGAFGEDIMADLEALHRQAAEAGQLRGELAIARQELDLLRTREGAGATGTFVHSYIPGLPWTVVHGVHVQGAMKRSGTHYDAAGHLTTFDVGSVRVERSLGSGNRPRLVVNDRRITRGDLYVDGVLQARVCEDDQGIEAG